MVDKLLFEYLTRKAGYTLDDVAERLGFVRSQLSRRLNGEMEFKRNEMEAWAEMIGATLEEVGAVFFPRLKTNATPPGTAVASGL